MYNVHTYIVQIASSPLLNPKRFFKVNVTKTTLYLQQHKIIILVGVELHPHGIAPMF